MQNLKRIVLIGLTVFVLHLPAIAQDETPTAEPTIETTVTDVPATEAPTAEPTDVPAETPVPPIDETPVNTEGIINALLVALVALVALGGGIVIVWGKWLYNSIPAIARPPAKDLVERVLGEAGRYVGSTPGLTDDQLFEIIQKYVRDIITDELPAAVDKSVGRAVDIAVPEAVKAQSQAAQKYNPPA